MADIIGKVTDIPGKGLDTLYGRLTFLLIGLLLGAFLLFMVFYFFKAPCCSANNASTNSGLSILGNPPNNIATGMNPGDNGSLVVRGSGGEVLAVPSGSQGQRNTFTDNTGITRDVTCYTAVYCVDNKCPTCGNVSRPTTCENCRQEGNSCGYGSASTVATYSMLVPNQSAYYGACCEGMACVNGQCIKRETQCVDKGQFCDYGPSKLSAFVNNPTYYGKCCGDYQCLNGVCTPPTQQCVQTGQRCGYAPGATAAAFVPSNTTYYGTCCADSYCYNNYCVEQACVQRGQACEVGTTTNIAGVRVNATACCDGLSCTNGMCGGTCMNEQGKCSTDSDCCSGLSCTNSVCQKRPTCISQGQTCAVVGAATSAAPANASCCSGLSCSNGKCQACKTSGICSSLGDCCSGYSCQNNYCQPLCKDQGVACSLAADCCSGLSCKDGYCMKSCLTAGKCSSSSDCCSGLYCSDNGYCVEQPTCANLGGKCSADSDCCSGFSCIGGACSGMCRTSGSCKSSSECCNGYYCSGKYVCTSSSSCQEKGATCSSDTECCSPYLCSNGVCSACQKSGACSAATGAAGACCAGYSCKNSVCAPS